MLSWSSTSHNYIVLRLIYLCLLGLFIMNRFLVIPAVLRKVARYGEIPFHTGDLAFRLKVPLASQQPKRYAARKTKGHIHMLLTILQKEQLPILNLPIRKPCAALLRSLTCWRSHEWTLSQNNKRRKGVKTSSVFHILFKHPSSAESIIAIYLQCVIVVFGRCE